MKKDNAVIVLASIGLLAISINFFLKDRGVVDFLDAVKDMAEIIILVLVYTAVLKTLKNLLQKPDFWKMFEGALNKWADRNEYLVCRNSEKRGQDLRVSVWLGHYRRLSPSGSGCRWYRRRPYRFARNHNQSVGLAESRRPSAGA
jgi:hypothetical protein